MTAKSDVSFESTPIWQEVKAILNDGKKKVLFAYKGTLHTEKEEVLVWELSSVEITRDYVKDIGESVTVVFRLGLGDYIARLYPYRNNLEFTLKRTPVEEGGAKKMTNSAILVTRYKAIFNPQRNPPVGAGELESHGHESLNLADMVEVHLELVDRSLEPLRIKTTGGVYRNATQESCIRAVLGAESDKIKVNGKSAIAGIEMVPADNKEVVGNIVLPSGLQITALPTYLQEKVSGVYNGGMGTFFQQVGASRFWFIYPLYDTSRFDKKGSKAVFYAVPQEKLPQVERSFRQDGEILKVAVTAQRRYTDSAEITMMNQGSGFRMPDARAFMRKPIQIDKDGPKLNRAKLNHEVAIKNRKDGINFAPVVSGVSSNPYVQRSRILCNALGQTDLVWENADPQLITPGMPCKYVYLSQGRPVSLKGTVLFVHAYATRQEKQGTSPFKTSCRITIACEPQSKVPTLPAQEAVGNA